PRIDFGERARKPIEVLPIPRGADIGVGRHDGGAVERGCEAADDDVANPVALEGGEEARRERLGRADSMKFTHDASLASRSSAVRRRHSSIRLRSWSSGSSACRRRASRTRGSEGSALRLTGSSYLPGYGGARNKRLCCSEPGAFWGPASEDSDA